MNDEQRDMLPERSPVMPGAARVGVLAGAGVVAVLGAAVALGAAAPAPGTGSTSVTDVASSNAGSAEVLDAAAWTAPSGETERAGGFGHLRGPGRHGFGAIEITAISGSSLSLATDSGWTRTITVGSDVEIRKGGEAIALADLAVGDDVRIHETRNDDGTFTLEAIVVVVPTAGGLVTAVDGDSVTVEVRGGATREIATTGSTTYRLGLDTTSRAELTVGDRILAFGTEGADNAFTATSIVIQPPHVIGEVTAVGASSFTMELSDGSTVTVTVDGDTVYRLRGVDDPGLDDIEVGERVGVAGTRSGSTIDAQVVGQGRGPGGDGFGRHGGRGGFGPEDIPAVGDDTMSS